MNALPTTRPGSLLALLAGLAGLASLTGVARRAGRDAQPQPRPIARRHAAASEATLSLPLARAATHWVQRPRGLVVDCEAGTLWLTFDGEERDIVLDAGQSHRCESDRRLAIHALAAARLHVRPTPMAR